MIVNVTVDLMLMF